MFTLKNVTLFILTNKRFGFNFKSIDLSMSTYLCVNIFILIGAIVYWTLVDFNSYYFLIGTFASIVNTIGLSVVNKAISCGPMGPVAAIIAISNILLVIVTALRSMKMPSYI